MLLLYWLANKDQICNHANLLEQKEMFFIYKINGTQCMKKKYM